MGFRSAVICEDRGITWPRWFRVKYADILHFPSNNSGLFATQTEYKTYCTLAELPEDVQKCVADKLVLVYLHECGGITRCEITPDSIIWTEPSHWVVVDDITHNFCMGCSDAKHYQQAQTACPYCQTGDKPIQSGERVWLHQIEAREAALEICIEKSNLTPAKSNDREITDQ